MLILRSTFAQPSLKVRSRFAQPSLMIAPHLRHTCATHFGKLSEFAKVNQLRQLADFPSLILRLSFAQPSLMIPPHLPHTCATLAPHTLANFQSLPKLISCASSPPRWRKLPPHCLSFVTYSAAPARRLSFVTYSAVPARQLSFAYPSLNLRLSFAYDCPHWRKLAACANS